MSHLEDLLFEYHEWQGYIVQRNVKVGPLKHVGWEGELDIVAYHPKTEELVHLEPSIDAFSRSKREQRFTKKFRTGQNHIFSDFFPWLNPRMELKQVAVLINAGSSRTHLGGGVRTVDDLTRESRGKIVEEGKMASGAIPERFPLLRTI